MQKKCHFCVVFNKLAPFRKPNAHFYGSFLRQRHKKVKIETAAMGKREDYYRIIGKPVY
jgi:hypothetical protein